MGLEVSALVLSLSLTFVFGVNAEGMNMRDSRMQNLNVEIYLRPGGGGTPLYGLFRYVPLDRVWFLEVLDP